MRIVFGIILLLHGLAHLFAGVLGIAGAVAFAVAGVAALARASWWPAYTVVAALGSLLLCMLVLPAAQAGVALNLAVASGVVLGMRLGWFDQLATD
jgi:hypothetical protein